MLAGLEAPALAGDGAVELDEERVGAAAVVGPIGHPDRVVERLRAVAGQPGHAGGRQLVAGHSSSERGGSTASTRPGYSRGTQEVADDLLPVLQLELCPVVELGKMPCPAQELAEAAARREET